MMMPGFTAEVSLHGTSGRYRQSASGGGGTGAPPGFAQLVSPQFAPCHPGPGPCLPNHSSPTGCTSCWQFADCTTGECHPCFGCHPPPPPCTCTKTTCCSGHCTTMAVPC
jgi:hypothetical protein